MSGSMYHRGLLAFYLFLAGYGLISAQVIPAMVVSNNNNPAPGHIFTALKTGNQSHMFAFDSEGTPVFYRQFPYFIENVQPWPDGCISYYDFNVRAYILLDQAQKIKDTIEMKNGYYADFHDFIRLPNAHNIVMSIELKTIDMSQVIEGGLQDATLSGLVIQELDETGELIFQWRSWDHIGFTDSYADLTAQYIDYIHPNSMWADTDSTLLLSCRNTSEVIKINRKDGQIIWRMGGKNEDFVRIGDSKGFTGQHSISMLNSGNLLLFDNSIDLENDPWLVKPVDPEKSGLAMETDQNSRGVEYILSENDKTITLLREFPHAPPYKANNMGFIQRLDNGHSLISWGSSATQPGMDISEYNEEGILSFEAGIENNTAHFYKVFKHPFYTELFSVTEDILEFEEVFVGVSDSMILNLYNPGAEDVMITGILSDNPAFQHDAILPILLKPGINHPLWIYFKPEVSGFQHEVITICSDTDSSRIAQQVILTGIGRYHVATGKSRGRDVAPYPNPTNGALTIAGLSNGDRIKIYHISGSFMNEYQVLEKEFIIDLSHMRRGTYLLEIETTQGYCRTHRIILQ